MLRLLILHLQNYMLVAAPVRIRRTERTAFGGFYESQHIGRNLSFFDKQYKPITCPAR